MIGSDKAEVVSDLIEGKTLSLNSYEVNLVELTTSAKIETKCCLQQLY